MSFAPQLAASLPETYDLLVAANLVVHPGVDRVVLHGSRGLAGGWRPNSDVDLSLIVDMPEDQLTETLFFDIARTTLENWQSPIEVDLAVIHDLKKCGLKCFEQTIWNIDFCQMGGTDCFGIYKIQKGFNGFVTNAGIQVQLMYPCLKIWQREERSRLPAMTKLFHDRISGIKIVEALPLLTGNPKTSATDTCTSLTPPVRDRCGASAGVSRIRTD